MFLTSKERSNCCWINQLSEKSHCQSLAERTLFVGFVGCLRVHTGHLLLILVAALQPVFLGVFFSCTPGSKAMYENFILLSDLWILRLQDSRCWKMYLVSCTAYGQYHEKQCGLEEMHTRLTLVSLISALCFLLAHCTCPWEDGSVWAVGLVCDES